MWCQLKGGTSYPPCTNLLCKYYSPQTIIAEFARCPIIAHSHTNTHHLLLLSMTTIATPVSLISHCDASSVVCYRPMIQWSRQRCDRWKASVTHLEHRSISRTSAHPSSVTQSSAADFFCNIDHDFPLPCWYCNRTKQLFLCNAVLCGHS